MGYWICRILCFSKKKVNQICTLLIYEYWQIALARQGFIKMSWEQSRRLGIDTSLYKLICWFTCLRLFLKFQIEFRYIFLTSYHKQIFTNTHKNILKNTYVHVHTYKHILTSTQSQTHTSRYLQTFTKHRQAHTYKHTLWCTQSKYTKNNTIKKIYGKADTYITTRVCF